MNTAHLRLIVIGCGIVWLDAACAPGQADTSPPTVALIAPLDGATVSAVVTVTAAASDNVNVAGVQLRLDSHNLGTELLSSPYEYAWDTTSVANGTHQLTAVARDAAGNSTTASTISVTTAGCQPKSCVAGVDCGSVADGCGHALNCGSSCPSDQTCLGTVCGDCPALACGANNCGPLTNACGDTLDCGGCSGTDVCDATNLCIGEVYALPADHVTVWKPGVTLNGGIPTNRTQCGATVMPSADDMTAITTALNNCPANGVVLLGPGVFQIAAGGLAIRKSNVTLRGSGAGVTILHHNGNGPGIVVGAEQYYYWFASNAIALTADAVKENDSVTVASTAGLQIGQLVHVNEKWDAALTYYDPDRQTNDYLGWGECRVANGDWAPFGCQRFDADTHPTDWIQRARAQSRPIGQAMEIKEIQGNTLTFTTKFHIDLRVSHEAHLVRPSNGDGDPVATVRGVGIENLTVENGGDGDFNANVGMYAVSHCWAKNIESRYTKGGAFLFDGTLQCELRDSYLHTAENPNPGGSGYAVEVEQYAADNLVENNVVWNFNKMTAMRSSGGGNVMGYNYFEDGYGQDYPQIVEVGLNGSHNAGTHYELFEGNQAFNFDSDSGFGNQIRFTIFRNHLTTLRRSIGYGTADGVKAQLTDQSNRRGIGLTVYQWWHSFVGNVIGYPDGYLQSPAIGFAYPSTFSPQPQGSVFRYEWLGGDFGPDDSPQYTPMWQLGYDGSAWYTAQEVTTQQRTLRDGNYDYFTKAVHWHGIGGTGASQTTPPAAATLPASLYLPSKPAFFGANNTWPWVDGSDAANPLPGTLPARTRFDAGTPNVVP